MSENANEVQATEMENILMAPWAEVTRLGNGWSVRATAWRRSGFIAGGRKTPNELAYLTQSAGWTAEQADAVSQILSDLQKAVLDNLKSFARTHREPKRKQRGAKATMTTSASIPADAPF
jgi:hypothetical protein